MFLSAFFEPLTRRDIFSAVALIFTLGVMGSQVAASIAEATDTARRAEEAVKSVAQDTAGIKTDSEQTKQAIRRVEDRVDKLEWMMFQILKRVDPAAATMVPPPPEPTGRR